MTIETKHLTHVSKTFLRAFAHILTQTTQGILLGIAVSGFVVCSVWGAYQYIQHLVSPDIEKFLTTLPPQSTKIYANDNTLLYEFFDDVKRTYIPLSSMSVSVTQATVAIEDKTFYEHQGVSLPAIVRSAVMDYQVGDTVYGGSTITQQLIKNSILTSEKSVIRKVAEIIWAKELENNLSKDEILERYLNLIPYGRNSAGVEAAALSYFGKNAKDLSVAESAYLAALPQAPSLYSPTGPNRNTLDQRKNYILLTMKDQGFLTAEAYKAALEETVTFIPYVHTIKAPHFVFWVKSELVKKFGEEAVNKNGLHVYTSLDPKMQALAESTVKEMAKSNTLKYRAHNAALVAINPKTGNIVALVGSKDYFGKAEPSGCTMGKNCLFEPNTDVSNRLRQTGSSFKPYVYVTAFGEEFKYTPATLVADISKNFGVPGGTSYRPQNYNGAQYGWVSARKALAGSLNIAAVNTLNTIGIEPVISTLRSVGVTAPLQNCGLSLALGSCEMTLLEHTSGFATFANSGQHNPATGILKITNGQGKVLEQNPPENKQVINAAAVYELVDIMKDNDARSYIFGKNNPLTLKDRPVAAKTGTTQNWKDGWTVGFTPDLAVGVWAGNNDGTLMKPGSDGVFVAAPLWNKFMSEALKDTPPTDFVEPYGVSRVAVDARGRIIKPRSAKQKLEIMADYAIPVVAIEPIKPKVLGMRAPEIPAEDNGKETTIILKPLANQVITASPFEVQIYTGSSTVETTVDLYVDGKIIATKTTAPFLFTVNEQLKNGWHTITARARHFETLESSYSIRVRTFFNPPPITPRGE